jgi:hypothetical protein
MSPRTEGLSDALAEYVEAVGLREHPELRALRLATDALAEGGMRSSAEQAQLLAFLIRNARSSRSAASPATAPSRWRWPCRPAGGS